MDRRTFLKASLCASSLLSVGMKDLDLSYIRSGKVNTFFGSLADVSEHVKFEVVTDSVGTYAFHIPENLVTRQSRVLTIEKIRCTIFAQQVTQIQRLYVATRGYRVPIVKMIDKLPITLIGGDTVHFDLGNVILRYE